MYNLVSELTIERGNMLHIEQDYTPEAGSAAF